MARENKKDRPWITRYALLAFKLSVSLTLFSYLISKVGGRKIIDNLQLLNPFSFLGAVALYLLAAYLSTLRWKLLVPQLIGTKRLFSMYMIGSFFNNYMPSGVGGDTVKAYYLSREMKARDKVGGKNEGELSSSLTAAIASVFMDRYIGFATLLAISMAVFPFGIRYLEKASARLPLIWVIPSIAVLFLMTTVAIFKFRIGERVRFLNKAYLYLQLYVAKRSTILRAMFYSAAVQILVIISVYILAKGLLLPVSFLSLLVFVPMIIMFSMIPVTISGIGLREGAFVFLLSALGIPPERAMALSLAWFLSVFSAGIWGLIEYLRFQALFGREVE